MKKYSELLGKKLLSICVILIIACAFGMSTETDALTTRRKMIIGLTFEWTSVASDIEINHIRMAGGRNERETHTAITRNSPKQFTYMPGNVNGMPEWMDVEWQYNITNGSTYEEEHSKAKRAQAHFDIKAIIPESAIEDVIRDSGRKQLKLIGTFNDDKLDLRYEVYQWRK